MRLPWYDSPTALAGWCRAVTRLLSLSKHRGNRLFVLCFPNEFLITRLLFKRYIILYNKTEELQNLRRFFVCQTSCFYRRKSKNKSYIVTSWYCTAAEYSFLSSPWGVIHVGMMPHLVLVALQKAAILVILLKFSRKSTKKCPIAPQNSFFW